MGVNIWQEDVEYCELISHMLASIPARTGSVLGTIPKLQYLLISPHVARLDSVASHIKP